MNDHGFNHRPNLGIGFVLVEAASALVIFGCLGLVILAIASFVPV